MTVGEQVTICGLQRSFLCHQILFMLLFCNIFQILGVQIKWMADAIMVVGIKGVVVHLTHAQDHQDHGLNEFSDSFSRQTKIQ